MATRAPVKKAAPKKVLSGLCNDINKMPQHEGTKPVSSSGVPMPVCTDWTMCSCSCHEKITQMYVLTDMVREEPEQPAAYLAWVRHERTKFSVGSPFESDDLAPLSSSGGTDAHPDPEGASTVPETGGTDPSSAPSQPPTFRETVGRTFTSTPTGRRPPGQLESDVLLVCDEFAHNVYEWEICTPKLVAERIGQMYAMEVPSTGAVDAVWDRWEKLGFATRERKPSRFVQFVADPVGMTRGQQLQMLKDRNKREKKRTQAELRRGSIRPRSR